LIGAFCGFNHPQTKNKALNVSMMIILSHNSLEPSSIVFFIGASDSYFNASEQDNVPGRVITNHPNMGKGYEGPRQQNSLKLGAAEVLQLELLEQNHHFGTVHQNCGHVAGDLLIPTQSQERYVWFCPLINNCQVFIIPQIKHLDRTIS
jgi:hypothetical protein